MDAQKDKEDFAAHVAIIREQDGCTTGTAKWRAWNEGPKGYAKRAEKAK